MPNQKKSHWKVVKNAKQKLVLFQKGLGPCINSGLFQKKSDYHLNL